jgi:quercetin dioxygenase-like cupin family protein
MTAETVSSSPVDVYLSDPVELEPTWFFGARTWVRTTAAQTGGSIGLIEQAMDPGLGSPYHVDHAEDEAFYVLAGELRFISEGRSWVAGAGGFAFLPRDIPHGFRVEGGAPARFLILTTPGGFEGFVTELSEAEQPAGPPDMDKVMQVAAEYSLEILGPLPE